LKRGLKLAELRCNTCKYHSSGFCVKLKENLPNILTKLFYGGAVSVYSGVVTYSGECRIEKEQKPQTELEVGVPVPESLSEEILETGNSFPNGTEE
jgi:hypothetical protein